MWSLPGVVFLSAPGQFGIAIPAVIEKSVSQHQIKALPTLILYRDGQLAGRLVGYQTKGKLTSELDALCAPRQDDNSADRGAPEPSGAAMAGRG